MTMSHLQKNFISIVRFEGLYVFECSGFCGFGDSEKESNALTIQKQKKLTIQKQDYKKNTFASLASKPDPRF